MPRINPNMANREVCNVDLCDFKTKQPFLHIDYANTTTTELTGEIVHAYGGQGHPKRIPFYGERGGTLTLEMQIQPFKLFSVLTGAAIENSATFLKRELLTAANGVLTLSQTPVGDVNVFAEDDDCGEPLDTTGEGTSRTLVDTSSNDKYWVYYIHSITTNVKRLNVKSTTFPKAFTAYMQTIYKTEDEEAVPYKMIAYKASPNGALSFSQTSTGDPATLTITCDLLADSDDNILDMILIEEDQNEG